jgi:hypothetical protein
VRTVFLAVALNALSIVLGVAAFYLASIGRDGWGWFLFVALLCAVAPSGKVTVE